MSVKWGGRTLQGWCEVRVVLAALRVSQLGHYIAISKRESDTWTELIKTKTRLQIFLSDLGKT